MAFCQAGARLPTRCAGEFLWACLTTIFLLFLSPGAVHLAGAAVIPQAGVKTALSTHVLNLTLAGAQNGWPESTEALAALTATVTRTVCSSLPSTVSECDSFLMSISSGLVGLQLSVQTASAEDSCATYNTLYDWSNNVNAPLEALRTSCAEALGVAALDPLTFRAGSYLMPCRNSGVYQFVPLCQQNEVPNTLLYVGNASGSTSLQSYFNDKLCGGSADCNGVSIVVGTLPSQSDVTLVNITGNASAFEAVLFYVADVRAAFVKTLVAANPGLITPPGPGNADAGVAASVVQMRHDGMTASLFSTSENRRYEQSYPITASCDTNTGLWALALLALLPILMITYLWVRHRGRRRAKKQQRRLILEDEKRIMQAYANPGGANGAYGDRGDGVGNNYDNVPGEYGAYDGTTTGAFGEDGTYSPNAGMSGADAGPPPGMGYQRTQTQDTGAAADGGTVWMMDADGNYYEVPSSQYQNPNYAADNENADGVGQYGEQQAGVGEYDHVGGDEAGSGEQYADPNDALQEVDPAANADGQYAQEGVQYQTYVDPNTGEVYQYEYEQAPEAADAIEDGADEAGTGEANGEEEYVDPNVADDAGETQETDRQYAVDPTTNEAYDYDPNNYAADGQEGESGLQTYVDPATGEVYQYDPNAVATE